jgi:hypothetical protein
MTDIVKKKSKKAKEVNEEEVDQTQLQADYVLKPTAQKPKLETSEWPLLLKVI